MTNWTTEQLAEKKSILSRCKGFKQQDKENIPESKDNRSKVSKNAKKGKRKPTQTNTNALTTAIMRYIRLKKGYAARVNTTGTYDPTMKRFRNSKATKGFPDVCAIKEGVFVGIEIKVGADKLSKHQIEQKELIEKAGGVYVVARDIDGFIERWNQI